MDVLTKHGGATVQADVAGAITAEYGSRRGWLANQAWRIALALGGLGRVRTIDWTRVQRFVFLCRGNICRSPYAARRARATGLHAASYGLAVGGNTTIDPTAAMVARRRGLDLERHQPRAIASAHVESADLLVAMEPAQLSMVHALARTRGAQSTLLGLWSMPRRVCLTDPFGLHEEYFNRCFMLIDSAIARMSAELTEASHVHSGS